VVVALDGSAASVWALRHGARIANALGLSIEAVTVRDEPDLHNEHPIGPIDHAAESLQADTLNAAFGSSPPARIEQKLLRGDTVAMLLEESRGAEMLVLGSRGRGGLASLLLGSVSAACVEHATCAVLVCHSDITGEPASGTPARVDGAERAAEAGSLDASGTAAAALDGSPRDQAEIVVGVNGTPASMGALRQGAQFARSMRLPLHAICASDSTVSPAINAGAVLANASKQVFGDTPPQWFHSSVREGTPASVLGRASRRARMLVIGYSDSHPSASMRASTSSAIALKAACPIVIFHSTHPVPEEGFSVSVA
jgi:nucleotide-binding universal stress UspA family protein